MHRIGNHKVTVFTTATYGDTMIPTYFEAITSNQYFFGETFDICRMRRGIISVNRLFVFNNQIDNRLKLLLPYLIRS